MSDDRKPKMQTSDVTSGPLDGPARLVLNSMGKLGVGLVGVGLLFRGAPALTLWVGFGLMALAATRALVLWIRQNSANSSSIAEDPQYTRTKAEIRKLRVLDGADVLGNTLYEQLEQVRLVKKQFDSVLRRRLVPGEVTFARFETPFETLYCSVLNRISSLGVDLKTWATIRDPLSKQSLEVSWKTALGAIIEAITEMERIVVALGGMETGQGTAGREMNDALEDLKSIASRIERFSKPT